MWIDGVSMESITASLIDPLRESQDRSQDRALGSSCCNEVTGIHSSHLWPNMPVFCVLLQCEDGADVDRWGSLQDHLLSDEQQPGSVLALRFGADLHRRGHPAAGPSLQPGHAHQARLSCRRSSL